MHVDVMFPSEDRATTTCEIGSGSGDLMIFTKNWGNASFGFPGGGKFTRTVCMWKSGVPAVFLMGKGVPLALQMQ